MTCAILVHCLPIQLIICHIFFGELKPQVTYEMETSFSKMREFDHKAKTYNSVSS